MLGLFRRQRLRELSTRTLLRRAYDLGWSASRVCGAYVLTNRFHGNVCASAPMNETALRELLGELIKGGHEAPP